jgi:hypothetical protein
MSFVPYKLFVKDSIVKELTINTGHADITKYSVAKIGNTILFLSDLSRDRLKVDFIVYL